MSEKKDALISVIIPVYKVEKYLDKCIRSVVNQTYTNLDIILIDDGSPDGCGEICDEWAEKDKRIRVIHQQNAGVSAARNAGLDIASGDYIAFVDSDDYIHTDFLQTLYSNITANDADMAICGYCEVDEQGQSFVSEDKETIEERLLDNTSALEYLSIGKTKNQVWDKLYKKALFAEVRFPIGKIHEDNFVTPRLLYACTRIHVTSRELYYYVQNPTSIMHTAVSARSMDFIEGDCLSLALFEEIGLNHLLANKAYNVYHRFISLRSRIPVSSVQDKKRIKEVKKMVRQSYLRYRPKISKLDILQFEAPRLFNFLRNVKKRILTRN